MAACEIFECMLDVTKWVELDVFLDTTKCISVLQYVSGIRT